MKPNKETVSQDLYQKSYNELDKFDQNSVDMELEARLDNQLAQWYETLNSEATRYDDKESRKKGYNMFALGLYFEGIKKAVNNPDFLENPKKALAGEFLIKNETGGIYHRNLPTYFDGVKFSLPFLNTAIRKMEKIK